MLLFSKIETSLVFLLQVCHSEFYRSYRSYRSCTTTSTKTHERATQAIICPSLMKWSQKKSHFYKFLLLLFGTYTGYQLNSYFNIVRICISLTGCQCCEQGSVDTGHTAEQRWLNWRYWGCTWKMTSNIITKKNTNTPFFLFTKH